MAVHVPFLHLLGAWGVFLLSLSPSDKILSLLASWKAWLASVSAQDTQTFLITLGLSYLQR